MQRYEFGEFILDLERGALLCDGREIELRRQSYDVLRVLVENAGNLVSKDQLFEQVWSNVAVTDDSITQCIADIRKALGDSDRALVRTLPRRGYTFTAKVTLVDEKTVSRSRRVVLYAVGSVLLIVIGLWLTGRDSLPTSIAILPFVDTGSYVDDVSVGAAFSDELRDQLSLVSELKVAPRSSSLYVVTQQTDAATMSELLGVSHVLEGTFKLEGDGLRIGVQLVDSKTGLVQWSEVFERQKAGMTDIQQSIAENIVRELLPDSDASAVLATASLSSADIRYLARGYYEQVRGREVIDSRLLAKAISLYEELIELDPSSAVAHARLADALLYSGDVDAAQRSIDRALQINPDISIVQDTLGKLYFAIDDQNAGAAWQKAIELDPYNADALASFAYWSWQQRDADAAAAFYRKALDVDPHSLRRHGDLGNFLGTQGRVAELGKLISTIEGRLSTTFANDPDAYRLVARLYELMGRNDVAIAWAIRARDLAPGDPESNWQLAELYASIGDDATALQLDTNPGPGLLFHLRRYDELVDVTEELLFDDPGNFMVRYLLAFAYNATGNYQGTLNILRGTHVMAGGAKLATTPEIEATVMFADALHALGRTDEANALAVALLSVRPIEQVDWWVHAYLACIHSIAGNGAAVRENLREIYDSPRLPWYPMIADSPCFQKYADDPVYSGLITQMDARRERLRAALPDTLTRYGVELQSLPAEK